jgi:hypothetical protein
MIIERKRKIHTGQRNREGYMKKNNRMVDIYKKKKDKSNNKNRERESATKGEDIHRDKWKELPGKVIYKHGLERKRKGETEKSIKKERYFEQGKMNERESESERKEKIYMVRKEGYEKREKEIGLNNGKNSKRNCKEIVEVRRD